VLIMMIPAAITSGFIATAGQYMALLIIAGVIFLIGLTIMNLFKIGFLTDIYKQMKK